MPRSAREVLEQEYLQVRSKILEVAAFFDRLSDADASNVEQTQLDLLEKGAQVLCDNELDKAARVQLLFSREYDASWREKFSI